jgi:PAS domain S-box-containing protein
VRPREEEVFRAVFEQSAVGVAVVELNGRPVLANAALERLLGYSAAELSRLTYHTITHPDDLALDAELAPKLAAGAINHYVVEKRYVRRDSRVVWGRLTVSLLRTSDGEPQFVLAMVEDIDDRKRAEHALRETEARFRSAFGSAGIGMALVEPGGRILEVNGALSQFLGHPAANLLGRDMEELTHPDDRAEAREQLRRLYDGEFRSSQTEKRYLHADGRTIWGLVSVSLVRNSTGTPVYLVFQVQDITERRRAKEALLESERRYRRVVETAYEGVWTIDRDAKTDYVNGRMADMLGYRAEEMLGRPMFDFMDDEARAEAERNFERRRRGVVELHEFRLRRKNGEPLWTLMSTNPVLDDDGQFVGALAMVTDITERKRAETALRESEARYRGLVELAPDGILVHCGGQVVFANDTAARLFGAAQPDEMVGLPVLDLVHPDYREQVTERVERLRAGGARSPLAAQRLLRRDGTVFEAEIAATSVTYQGRPAVQTVVHDVTERRRSEAALRELEGQFRQAQKMEAVGQLAGGIAHDFNNLLTVITTYSELLLERLDEGDPRRRDAVEIRDAGGRAASLTAQLLAFGRKQVLQPRVLSLNTVVSGVEPMIRRLIGEDVHVVMRPAPHLGPVRADPGQLEQVLMNLVVNARDAMPRGGTLSIEMADVRVEGSYAARHPAVAPGPYVMLVVSDTGVGMDDATRSRAFEPFFTTKGPGRGTGLGLSTVYGIVTQSGGHVWCYSEPGRGTAFKIYLPRADGAELRPAEPGQARSTAGGSEILLLVEDEEPVRVVSRRILERHGYTVLEARDGADALHVAARYPGTIDAVVTDLVMPELTGREVYRALAAWRPGLRVLYMSGYTDDDILRRGLADPGAAFLQKPFTAASLARAVRAVLDGQGAAGELIA